VIDSRAAPYDALLLCASLGVLFLAHASLKLFLPTLSLTAEVVGGIALILGVWTRIVAPALAPAFLGAIVTVHGALGFFFTHSEGRWEYLAFWTLALIVQALLGAYALRLPRPVRFEGKLKGAQHSQ
jgi:putative oxidoreductase